MFTDTLSIHFCFKSYLFTKQEKRDTGNNIIDNCFLLWIQRWYQYWEFSDNKKTLFQYMLRIFVKMKFGQFLLQTYNTECPLMSTKHMCMFDSFAIHPPGGSVI